MKKLINVHNTWISFDPIVGCTNNCEYCFAQLIYKNHFSSISFIDPIYSKSFLTSIEAAYYKNPLIQLAKKLSFHTSKDLANYPISIGNNTDMLLPENLSYLLSFLHWCNNQPFILERGVAIVTKCPIPLVLIEKVRSFNYNLYLFCSLTFCEELEPGVIPSSIRLQQLLNIKKFILQQNIKNIKLIHLLRPFLLFKNQIEQLPFYNLKTVFDAFVAFPINFYELEYNNNTLKYVRAFLNEYNVKSKTERFQYFSSVLLDFLNSANKHGLFYFIQTACALAFLQGKAGYSGATNYPSPLFCERCSKYNPNQFILCNIFQSKIDDLTSNFIKIFPTISESPFVLQNGTINFLDPQSQSFINLLRISTGLTYNSPNTFPELLNPIEIIQGV